MSLRQLIKDNVQLAFDQLDDIAVMMDFTMKGARTYDFNTGQVGGTSTTIGIKGVVEYTGVAESDATGNSTQRPIAKFIINKANLTGMTDFSQFDSFTVTDPLTGFVGNVYTVVSYEDNDYSIEGTASGE